MDTIANWFKFLENYDTWVKYSFVVWMMISVCMIGILLIKYPRGAEANPGLNDPAAAASSQKPNKQMKVMLKTGDATIDRVIDNLNALESARDGRLNDSELASALRPLFTRPAFYDIREENWEYFLYPLCKSRTLLEEYQHEFRSKSVRDGISEAVQLMVKLQNAVADLYGPNFSVTDHIKNYLQDSNLFIKKLPNREKDVDQKFFEERNETVRKIKQTLSSVGLA